MRRSVRKSTYSTPSVHTRLRPYDNHGTDCIFRKRSSYFATISCIRCTIFCSRNTNRINVTQEQIEDRYIKPTQAQLQMKLTETSRNTCCHRSPSPAAKHTMKKWRLVQNAGTALYSARTAGYMKVQIIVPAPYSGTTRLQRHVCRKA